MAQMKLRNWQGHKISAEVKQAAGRVLYKGASYIHDQSVRIAPLDEGTLIQTSGVAVDEEKGRASIYYTTPYAVRLHESQGLNIRRGRSNKYLEKPMLESGDQVREMFAKELKDIFKG